MSSIPHDRAVGHDVGHGVGHDDHAHHPGGIMRWVMTTNHKDIGTLYLWFSFVMFIVGGIMALTIRAELFKPGLQIVLNGANNGQMPAWKGQLSATEIAAVVTFTKNSWSNKTGQIVQPADVLAARK